MYNIDIKYAPIANIFTFCMLINILSSSGIDFHIFMFNELESIPPFQYYTFICRHVKFSQPSKYVFNMFVCTYKL